MEDSCSNSWRKKILCDRFWIAVASSTAFVTHERRPCAPTYERPGICISDAVVIIYFSKLPINLWMSNNPEFQAPKAHFGPPLQEVIHWKLL